MASCNLNLSNAYIQGWNFLKLFWGPLLWWEKKFLLDLNLLLWVFSQSFLSFTSLLIALCSLAFDPHKFCPLSNAPDHAYARLNWGKTYFELISTWTDQLLPLLPLSLLDLQSLHNLLKNPWWAILWPTKVPVLPDWSLFSWVILHRLIILLSSFLWRILSTSNWPSSFPISLK